MRRPLVPPDLAKALAQDADGDHHVERACNREDHGHPELQRSQGRHVAVSEGRPGDKGKPDGLPQRGGVVTLLEAEQQRRDEEHQEKVDAEQHRKGLER